MSTPPQFFFLRKAIFFGFHSEKKKNAAPIQLQPASYRRLSAAPASPLMTSGAIQ